MSYAEGVDNAQKTVNLLQAADALSGGVISKWFKSRNEKARLKTELGQWHDLLYDRERNVYHNPVLSSAAFNKYMEECDGTFRPVGRCLATATWAQLVHALGITPTQNNILTYPGESFRDR